MKLFISGFLSGAVLLTVLFTVLNLQSCGKEAIPQAIATVTAEKHQEEISQPRVEVFRKGKELMAKTETETIYYGKLSQEIKIPLSSVQYKHRIGVGVAVINTDVLLSLGYIYKKYEFSMYGGYDANDKEWKGGAGFKYWFDIK